MSRMEQAAPLGWALGAAPTFLVAMRLVDRIAQSLGQGPQLAQPVLAALAFVFGRDTRLKGYLQDYYE